ncbi:MAG: hypothetical protein Q8O38_08385 [Sulfurimicrobium sp.]|nr:hypothetical protein [Sulfurimicrobium sp.]
MKLGRISSHARIRMRRQGMSEAALQRMLESGRVEQGCHGDKTVYFDLSRVAEQTDSENRKAANSSPFYGVYAVLDKDGEVITVGSPAGRGRQERRGKLGAC